ncbi:double-strand break repair protein AddB [Roseicella frigidaeris]|uniref:Double-strand break repair protein AddB n=1 Tax=Roseicella frigidaeris TaxID=2230885 RepID=A0A327MEB5_9PROT|nr:double-strand break repair protein AddB [Roseicella frigidaeris]RAI60622.1 double-strand break repair protein AddB [Roseicella frigidaeris]
MNLFAIPAHLPFLDCLAAGVLRRLPDPAPDHLSRVTILLPTRRSARALRVAFLRAADGHALLLPRMRALAGLSTEDADELALPSLLDLPPAVDPLRRQAVLAGFITRLPKERGGPATPEQAWSLAGALATLLDEIALEETDLELLARSLPEALNEHWLERLERLVPEVHAAHWQITLTFLRGVLAAWQHWLAQEELLDIGMRRVKALWEQTRAWQKAPPAHPVVAAGIGVGGTIPAAEELLRVVARLDHGAVVLHGLDAGSAEDRVWEAIREAPTHPFCGQQRLLHRLGAGREDIARWPGCAPEEAVDLAAPAERPALLGMALRPAAGLPAWQSQQPSAWRPALAGLTQLTAPDAQAEAVAIALTLREALEDPKARVALVTPDRDLARRVSAELARHGVTADDSAGEPLGETPAGGFLRLLARMAAAALAPVPLLAALKHPLCAGGWPRMRWIGAVRRLEQAALRGARPAPGLAGLRAAARAGLAREKQAEALAEVMALLDLLEAALGEFAALAEGEARPPRDLLAAHLAAAEALAGTEEMPGGLRLYAGEEGEALAAHLAALEPAMAAMPPVAAAAWPALFDAAMDGASAPSLRATRGRDSGAHPRVEILGLLEARLLTFDRVVLGALDETVWPLATDPGPWMSRPMRKEFGLPEPEARIGRVCADFLLAACSAPEAVLSRAARRGGAPTVPARWLTRIETFLQGQDGLALPQSPALGWAGLLDRPAAVTPCARPAPRPSRAKRPTRLSVTQVETLIADPYAFYARQVLGLRPLEPLDAEAGVLDYGNLVHAAMAHLVRRLSGQPWPGEDAARALWEEAAEAALAEAAPRPGLAAFWTPRLARIGGFVLEREAALRRGEGPIRSLVEVKGELPLRLVGGEVVLQAKADRIDILPQGLRLLDYKTGAPPSGEEVRDGRKPQLTLEAAIAAAGGFAGVPAGDGAGLLYWRLSGGPTPGEEKLVAQDPAVVRLLAEEAVTALAGLVGDFLLGDRPFTARPHPKRAPAGNDYDHLSRLAEWAGAEDARGPA